MRRAALILVAAAVPLSLSVPAYAGTAPAAVRPAAGTFAVPTVRTADGGFRTQEVHTASAHTLAIDYQVQQTGYWCGPASTRIALSARIAAPSQATLAGQLGTTVNGTDWIGQVTGVLDSYVGWYETKEMPNDPPTQEQRDLLWRDVVLNIDNDYPIVANIVAPPGNQPPGYPSDQTIYHYFTVIGYDDANQNVLIADPASFSGNQIYWLTFNQLATLIPPKGYSA